MRLTLSATGLRPGLGTGAVLGTLQLDPTLEPRSGRLALGKRLHRRILLGVLADDLGLVRERSERVVVSGADEVDERPAFVLVLRRWRGNDAMDLRVGRSRRIIGSAGKRERDCLSPTHVGLEDVAAVDGEGVADVADRVAGQRADVLPLAAARWQYLQATAASSMQHRERAKVGVRTRLGKRSARSSDKDPTKAELTRWRRPGRRSRRRLPVGNPCPRAHSSR